MLKDNIIINDIHLVFVVKGVFQKILLSDINYVINDGRKIRIHAVSFTLKLYGSVKEVIQRLDKKFYLSHGNLIINLANIESIGEKGVQFANGDSVYIGIHNLRLTRQAYRAFIKKVVLEN